MELDRGNQPERRGDHEPHCGAEEEHHQRQAAGGVDISGAATAERTAPPASAELGCDGEEMTLMQPAAAYSNGLGFAGAAGGTAVAFSTRAIRFERAAAGFCQSRSASFMASAIGSRTTPLAWSTQP